jgi:hypothetical protein
MNAATEQRIAQPRRAVLTVARVYLLRPSLLAAILASSASAFLALVPASPERVLMMLSLTSLLVLFGVGLLLGEQAHEHVARPASLLAPRYRTVHLGVVAMILIGIIAPAPVISSLAGLPTLSVLAFTVMGAAFGFAIPCSGTVGRIAIFAMWVGAILCLGSSAGTVADSHRISREWTEVLLGRHPGPSALMLAAGAAAAAIAFRRLARVDEDDPLYHVPNVLAAGKPGASAAPLASAFTTRAPGDHWRSRLAAPVGATTWSRALHWSPLLCWSFPLRQVAAWALLFAVVILWMQPDTRRMLAPFYVFFGALLPLVHVAGPRFRDLLATEAMRPVSRGQLLAALALATLALQVAYVAVFAAGMCVSLLIFDRTQLPHFAVMVLLALAALPLLAGVASWLAVIASSTMRQTWAYVAVGTIGGFFLLPAQEAVPLAVLAGVAVAAIVTGGLLLAMSYRHWLAADLA